MLDAFRRTCGVNGARWATIACVAAAAAGAVQPARAGIPDADGVYHACYTKSGATLRIIDPLVTRCGSNETEITWAESGPQGDAGPPGPTGPRGPRGPGNAFTANNFSSGFVESVISADAANPTTIVSLPLPAGRFAASATVGVRATVAPGTLIPFGDVECALSTGAGAVGAPSRTTLGGRPSSYASVPVSAVVALTAPGTVTLACVADASLPMSTRPSTLTAVQVETLTGP